MKLSEFELDVMQIFWDHGPTSAPIAHEVILEQKDVAYATVKTIIDRLEEKGAIKRQEKQGRTIIYAAKVKKKVITKNLIPNFVRRFFEGNPSNLIAHLIEDGKLNKEEISMLQDVLKNKPAAKTRRRSR